MMLGVTDRGATPSSFSKRVKNTLGNFFPFTMATVTGDEEDTQEDEEENKNGRVDGFVSQVSWNSSTHKIEASTYMENGYLDRFGAVRTINNTVDGKQRSRGFKTTHNPGRAIRND